MRLLVPSGQCKDCAGAAGGTGVVLTSSADATCEETQELAPPAQVDEAALIDSCLRTSSCACKAHAVILTTT